MPLSAVLFPRWKSRACHSAIQPLRTRLSHVRHLSRNMLLLWIWASALRREVTGPGVWFTYDILFRCARWASGLREGRDEGWGAGSGPDRNRRLRKCDKSGPLADSSGQLDTSTPTRFNAPRARRPERLLSQSFLTLSFPAAAASRHERPERGRTHGSN